MLAHYAPVKNNSLHKNPGCCYVKRERFVEVGVSQVETAWTREWRHPWDFLCHPICVQRMVGKQLGRSSEITAVNLYCLLSIGDVSLILLSITDHHWSVDSESERTALLELLPKLICSDLWQKMKAELAKLLALYSEVEENGGSANLVLSTKGGKSIIKFTLESLLRHHICQKE